MKKIHQVVLGLQYFCDNFLLDIFNFETCFIATWSCLQVGLSGRHMFKSKMAAVP